MASGIHAPTTSGVAHKDKRSVRISGSASLGIGTGPVLAEEAPALATLLFCIELRALASNQPAHAGHPPAHAGRIGSLAETPVHSRHERAGPACLALSSGKTKDTYQQ